jgi:hypothetical protein
LYDQSEPTRPWTHALSSVERQLSSSLLSILLWHVVSFACGDYMVTTSVAQRKEQESIQEAYSLLVYKNYKCCQYAFI